MRIHELIETLFVEGTGIEDNWSKDNEVQNFNKLVAEVSKDFTVSDWSYTYGKENFSYMLRVLAGKVTIDLKCNIATCDGRVAKTFSLEISPSRYAMRCLKHLLSNEVYNCLRSGTVVSERVAKLCISTVNYVWSATPAYKCISTVTGKTMCYSPVLGEAVYV